MSIFTVIEQAKRRDDVVTAYADEIDASRRLDEDIDWREISQAIVDKWSVAGLAYIKDQAWKLIA